MFIRAATGVNDDDIEVFEGNLEEENIWEETSVTMKTNSLTLWLVFLIASAQKKHYIPDVAIGVLPNRV